MLVSLLWVVMSASPVQTPAAAQTNPALIRVFVHTDEGGDPAELAARRESVKDLAASLGDKKKTIAIVTDEDAADLAIDVRDRGVTVPKVVFGVGGRPGQPPGGSAPMRTAILHVALEWAGDAVEFRNKNSVAENRNGWKSAADDLAKQIEKWIVERRAEILKRRRGGP